jgi:beta-mannosidase
VARILSVQGERRRRLKEGWSFLIDDSAGWSHPDAIPSDAVWRAAKVPGALAQALIEQGCRYEDLPPLDGIDCWYRLSFENEGEADLVFHGLATLAEVFLDGALRLSSDNMFVREAIPSIQPGRHDLHIRFRSVLREIESKKGRARWRPRMIVPRGLRDIRTTALGRLPGFSPPTPPVGPYRPVELIEHGPLRLDGASVRSEVDATSARVAVTVDVATPGVESGALFCGERHVAFERRGERRLVAELRLDGYEPWAPHSIGAPRLYPLRAEIGGVDVDLGRTGFRRVDLSRGGDGADVSLSVNGAPLVCLGAVWTGADPHSLDGAREAIAPLLESVRDAGMNMLRVPGILYYESDDFYELCDELGIMVWQDFAFANFDYPFGAPEFRASVAREARDFLSRVEASPSLAVTCGGSEVYQQAAMMGIAEEKWRSPLFEEVLPEAVRQHRPDVIYVENSPSGGALPFQSDHGFSHYYGVGAYRRPLEDARRARVRFATECLGFSCPPETASLLQDFGSAQMASPLWEARIPRDMGALQDFRDVTEHYMRLLYGCEPERLRACDPDRYLDLARGCVAEAMTSTISEWRRCDSGVRGALVWFLKDLWPGPGWGVLDSEGLPKSSYYALKRAFAPAQAFLIDEGVNGLHLHLVNAGLETLEGEASLTCYRDGRTVVMHATRAIRVAPGEVSVTRDVAFWGGFFDTARAYNFGPPSHDVTAAAFRPKNNPDHVLEAFHFPLGLGIERADCGLRAEVTCDGGRFSLLLNTESFAQSVCMEDDDFLPEDNWFHLAPGRQKRVMLRPLRPSATHPRGSVRALNGKRVAYEWQPA